LTERSLARFDRVTAAATVTPAPRMPLMGANAKVTTPVAVHTIIVRTTIFW
jgi:hypothetical protein